MKVELSTWRHPIDGYQVRYDLNNDNIEIYKRRLSDDELTDSCFNYEVYTFVNLMIKWNGKLGPYSFKHLPCYIGYGDFQWTLNESRKSRANNHAKRDLIRQQIHQYPENFMCLRCSTGITGNEAEATEALMILDALSQGFQLTPKNIFTYNTSLDDLWLMNKQRSLKGEAIIEDYLNLEKIYNGNYPRQIIKR